MSTPDPRLADLINRSGPAHHQAFLDADGWDPEWPIWYAEYFWAPIQEFLPREVTKSELTYLLVKAYKEWPEGADWTRHLTDILARNLTPTGATDRPYTFG